MKKMRSFQRVKNLDSRADYSVSGCVRMIQFAKNAQPNPCFRNMVNLTPETNFLAVSFPEAVEELSGPSDDFQLRALFIMRR